jgi:hypothetical protein
VIETTFGASGVCARATSNFRAASWRSAGLAMWYRSKTLRVRCPVTCMATRPATPALTKFRTAVRRKSWRSTVGTFRGFVESCVGTSR